MRAATRTMQGLITATLILALTPGLALAYVGPGAGISMLGALWGLIVGVVMALGVILFWPIRMMIRKMKANKANAEGVPGEQATNDDKKAADNSPAS
jgi:hypothetical protein